MLDPAFLTELTKAVMPFGKYQGRKLLDIPEEYLVWMNKQGWPKGKLGAQLALVYEMKLNGLDKLLDPIRRG